jgi:predicted TIM-barrel fold metal-dependent hydrolase
MEKVFDIHIHYSFEIPLEKTIEIFKKEFVETGTQKGAFLSLPHHARNGIVDYEQLQNIKALALKQAFSPNFYAFAGLVHPQDYTDKKSVKKAFLRQAEEYFSVGYDGMKMLEGYPSLLKVRGIPLDDEIYDSYYAFMEENRYPIIMHVANPNENWDISKADKYAVQAGRVYDSSYPTKDEITRQVFSVMKKYPKLKLILAHWGFFSQEKENAERFLGDYENTMLDITPGGEQYLNMMKDWKYWHSYIEKYQDKILYGTDFYAFPDDTQEEWHTAFTRRPNFIRQFFETDTEHTYLDERFQGVLLEKTLREKIYWDNAEKLLGKASEIDKKYMLMEVEQLIALPEKQSEFADVDLQYILEMLK